MQTDTELITTLSRRAFLRNGTLLLAAADSSLIDQGADTFEFLEHEVNSGRRFVIRAAYDRCIFKGHDAASLEEEGHLRSYAAELPAAGEWVLSVTQQVNARSPKKKGRKVNIKRSARDANMAVAFSPVRIDRLQRSRRKNAGRRPARDSRNGAGSPKGTPSRRHRCSQRARHLFRPKAGNNQSQTRASQSFERKGLQSQRNRQCPERWRSHRLSVPPTSCRITPFARDFLPSSRSIDHKDLTHRNHQQHTQ